MMRSENITFEPVSHNDLDALVAIRIEAMHESLERIGRFDPARARERFSAGFSPEHTQYIVVNNEHVGFVVTKPQPDVLLLDHLYIKPVWQNKGIGAAVVTHVFGEAEKLKLPIRVGALRDSESNKFYLRHGFKLVESSEFDNYYVRPSATT